MTLCIRDVIAIPATKPPLVVKVGEINDEQRKAFHAQEYVITGTVAEGLRRVVSSLAESADKGFPGQGVWVSGSFGTGKSHFLSFAGMLVRGEGAAWAREIPGLAAEGLESPRHVLGKRPVFVVPFNSLDRPDDFRLGLYDAVARELARQGLPPVELTFFDRILGWFEGLAADAPALWQALFNRSVIVTSQAEYEAEKLSASGCERLAREVATHIALPPETSGGAFTVELAEGVRRVAAHVRDHGFAAVLFLVDELTLFLINAQDKTRPIVDLKALLEAEGAVLPVWALVVRHAPLEDVVRDVGQDVLDNVKGRFASKEVEVQDVDLYQVLGQRVLKPQPGQEQVLDTAVRDSLDRLPREQLDGLHRLYGQKRFESAVRDLYPFHPAIVDTLVSVTHLLSRERTAISVLYDMLFDLADEPLGTLLPYHRAFDYLIEGMSDSELKDRPMLQAAKAILRGKVTPLLEEVYLGDAVRVARGQAVAQTIILGQLTDKGVSLQGKMTPSLIAALNTAVLNARVVMVTKVQLDETLALLCDRLLGTFKRDGEAVVVELSVGLDPAEELRRVTADVTEWRRRALLELMGNFFGTDRTQGRTNLNIKWRGTRRAGTVQAIEPTASVLPAADTKAEFSIWIAMPRFAGDPRPPAPPRNGVPGALWLPREATEEVAQQLDNLARILWLIESPDGKRYVAEKYSGEEGRRLSESWQAGAFQLRDTMLGTLTPLYRQGGVSASVSAGEQISGGATLQDALKDLAGRLLDARYRQHPEFTVDVSPRALESLYQAVLKGDGRVGIDMGEPLAYAQGYGIPLRVVRPEGSGYVLDLGNSRYIQEIEGALADVDGVTISALEKKLSGTYGLEAQVTRFLARLIVVFRDRRVVRGHAPFAIEDPASLELMANDVLRPGQRVSAGEWATFGQWYTAIGAGVVPGEPSVRAQDTAWASLRKFVEQQARAHTQWRKAAVEAAKTVGGAPLELEQILNGCKLVVETAQAALKEATSEEGIRALAQASAPSRSLQATMAAIQDMVGRLQDPEVSLLYSQLRTSEKQVQAREAIAGYVVGKKSHQELLAELGALRQAEVKLPSKVDIPQKGARKLILSARFGQLRAALEGINVRPAEGWQEWKEVSDDADVIVEVRHDDDA